MKSSCAIALLNGKTKTFAVASYNSKDEAGFALRQFLASGSVEGFNRFCLITDPSKFLASIIAAGYSRVSHNN